MTTIGAQRFHQLADSRRRTWKHITKVAAAVSGATSSSSSDNTACEEASCQRNLANDTKRSLDKTRGR